MIHRGSPTQRYGVHIPEASPWERATPWVMGAALALSFLALAAAALLP